MEQTVKYRPGQDYDCRLRAALGQEMGSGYRQVSQDIFFNIRQ